MGIMLALARVKLKCPKIFFWGIGLLARFLHYILMYPNPTLKRYQRTMSEQDAKIAAQILADKTGKAVYVHLQGSSARISELPGTMRCVRVQPNMEEHNMRVALAYA